MGELPYISDPNHEGVDSFWYDTHNPDYRVSGSGSSGTVRRLDKYERLEGRLAMVCATAGLLGGAVASLALLSNCYLVEDKQDIDAAIGISFFLSPIALIFPGFPISLAGGYLGGRLGRGINYFRRRLFPEGKNSSE